MTGHEDLRRLSELATPGPWFGSAGGRYIYGATPGDQVAECVRRHDAELLRAARNALPGLLDDLDAARAEVEALRGKLAAVEGTHTGVTTPESDRNQPQNDREAESAPEGHRQSDGRSGGCTHSWAEAPRRVGEDFIRAECSLCNATSRRPAEPAPGGVGGRSGGREGL